MKRLFIIVLIGSIFSCNHSDNSKSNSATDTKHMEVKDTFPIKEVYIDKGNEESWGSDIRLSIVEITKTDSFITYFAKSLYGNINVGFKIIIPNTSPKSDKELVQVLTLQSSGNISDNFVQKLSILYNVKVDTVLHFVPSRNIAFIDLNELVKANFGQEPTNKATTKEIKVFFEADNPDDNAELYININETEHWLEIREKDESYRKQVIKGLTTK